MTGGVRRRSPSAILALLAVTTTGCSDPPAPPEIVAVGPNQEIAIFAGGCFWTMESKFDHVPGVVDVVVGVTGGLGGPPTVEAFANGRTGHVEAVAVTFDRSKTSYRELVDRFWRMIDPTDANGQVCDRGPNYATAVFATSAQVADAEASRQAAAAVIGPERFVTPVRPAVRFWMAPAEAQDFARNQPERYARYDKGCARTTRLKAIWGEAQLPG